MATTEQRKYTPQETIQIYTDWANHYLEKCRSKKRITSLASDCADGVLLAEVIESVTCQKIPDINRKPKTQTQMLDNINLCLALLKAHHVSGVESISGLELRDGKLKAILALFFALSRHKQVAKQKNQQNHYQQQNQHHQYQQNIDNAVMTPNRSTAIHHAKGAVSSIPLPGSALPSRKCPPDKIRPILQQQQQSTSSSRASSPALSMIPRVPPTYISNPYQQQTPFSTPSCVTSQTTTTTSTTSVLDKLRLFKSSNSDSKTVNSVTNGKRTSSSSGVSSARSERSDSSASLDPKPQKNTSKLTVKQAPTVKTSTVKNGPPTQTKKELILAKHVKSDKVLAVKSDPKVKQKNMTAAFNMAPVPGTGIPKPTAAIKGTTKPTPNRSRDDSDMTVSKPSVAMVSPMKNDAQLFDEKVTEKDVKESNMATDSLTVEPMRPLLGGYCSTLTLPTRSRQYGRIQSDGGTDYCEMSLVNGYLSDGEMLMHHLTDVRNDGYMSEGGAVLYARRLHPPIGASELNNDASLFGNNSIGGLAVLTERECSGRRGGGGQGRSAALLAEEAHQQSAVPSHPAVAATASLNTTGNSGNRSSSRQRNGPHWKRYNDSPGVGSPPPPPPAPGSPTGGQGRSRERRSSPHHGISGGGDNAGGNVGGGGNSRHIEGKATSGSAAKENKSRVRGVPQSFGYVKRGSAANGAGTNGVLMGVQNGEAGNVTQQGQQSGKTASVSVVPRTKVKVSGGTQTCSSDLQPPSHTKASASQFKSYSLSTNAASQLSQSVRERLLLGSQSLPKGGAGSILSQPQGAMVDYGSGGGGAGLVLRHHHHGNGGGGGRGGKMSDGSLSDTQAMVSESASNPYAPWLRHSNTYSVTPRLSETDSMESLTSLPGHRSSLTQHTRLLRDSPSRLSRSNSIRSTKSEKLYPSMLHRNNSNAESESEPYYCLPIGSAAALASHWSQPTSPAPGSGSSRAFPLGSPTHNPSNLTPRHSLPKNDDVHGSSISLVSTASSLYSSAEEKQAHEIKKLRRELIEAQDKVQTLTSQLSTNAHVVSAFEQSLSSMTQRLQMLTATAERKDSELAELRHAMESLRAQSIQAGIGSMAVLARQPSSDSVSSLSSACSLDKQDKSKKKKGWLRSSFTKAFSRNAKVTKVQCQSESEPELQQHHQQQSHQQHYNQPSQLHYYQHQNQQHQSQQSQQQLAQQTDPGQEVAELQKQLREKDLVLTDIRLEALNSAHQLESLKDTVMKMRNEMLSLKENNERLQRMVSGGGSGVGNSSSCSMASSSPPLPADLGDLRTSTPVSLDTLADLMSSGGDLTQPEQQDGKRITLAVYLGQPHTFERFYAEWWGGGGGVADDEEETMSVCKDSSSNGTRCEIAIAHTIIGASTTWAQLDNTVRRQFKQHVTRLDPGGGLGLGSDAIAGYRLGEAERKPDLGPPDLLPVGYAVGRVSTLHVVLQPVAALAFDTLIPKGVAQRLVSLLFEHRRLVLCGASGTGKTYLAQKLAEFHAHAQGRDPVEAVATFNVENKSPKELRQYLTRISEQSSSGTTSNGRQVHSCGTPSVVVLDNLHKAGAISEALGSITASSGSAASCSPSGTTASTLSDKSTSTSSSSRHFPCLLGTMAQSACSAATSLQLQHGFRWVLVAPHMEPAKGLLGRVLRRRLAALELQSGETRPELAAVVGWLPMVWQHVNGFLEGHSSGDVVIGPRLFLGCPLDLDAARAWFADVWNYSLAPYLRDAAREGLQLYGRRAPQWKDPCQFVLDTYPFPGAAPQGLTRITARDVGLESIGGGCGGEDGGGGDGGSGGGGMEGESEGDPLLNMLMRLQEAANYSTREQCGGGDGEESGDGGRCNGGGGEEDEM